MNSQLMSLVACLLFILGISTGFNTCQALEPDWAESVDECGGILVGTAGIISYRRNSTYRNNEFCTWTIRTNSYANVTIQLTGDGLEANFDYIHVAKVASNGVVAQGFRIFGGDRTIYSVDGPIMLVSFRSDYTVHLRGFQINFQGYPSDNNINSLIKSNVRHQHFHLIPNITSQEFNYPTDGNYYGSNELTTIVISRGTTSGIKHLHLLRSDIEEMPECSSDVLNIYTLQLALQPPVLRKGRFCQEDYNATLEFSTTNTIVLVFRSDDANEFKGFSVVYFES